MCECLCAINISHCDKPISGWMTSQWILHTFFYRQLHFRSQPGSCLAVLANGLETEGTLPAKVCLNDFSQLELSFGNKISMRNQIF